MPGSDEDGGAGEVHDDDLGPPVAATVAPVQAAPQGEGWKPKARIAGWVFLGASGAVMLSAIGTLGASRYYAGQWNDDSRCLVGGRYRISNCGDDYQKAVNLQGLGAEIAVAAGAVAVTAVVLLLSTRPQEPRSPRRAPRGQRRTVSFGPGPGQVGLACAGTF